MVQRKEMSHSGMTKIILMLRVSFYSSESRMILEMALGLVGKAMFPQLLQLFVESLRTASVALSEASLGKESLPNPFPELKQGC